MDISTFFSTFCVSVLEDPIPYFIQISKLKSPGAFLEQQERTNYYTHTGWNTLLNIEIYIKTTAILYSEMLG